MLHRVRAEWPVAVASFLLILGATSLLAGGALYGDAVGQAGLEQAVRDAEPTDRGIVARTNADAAAFADVDTVVARELGAIVGPSGGTVARVIRSDVFADAAAAPDTTDLTKLASYDDLEAHAALVAGAWPTAGRAPLEAVLSEPAAAALGLAPGDRLTLVNRADDQILVDLAVVGIYRPDRQDPFWSDDALELGGVQVGGSFTTRGPFVVRRDDLLGLGLGRTLEFQWRGLIAAEGLRIGDLAGLARAVGGFGRAVSASLPGGPPVHVASGLPAILDAVGRSALVSQSAVLLVTIQFAILAGYALVLVAGIVLDHRQAETALLRARGAGSGHLALMAVGEAAILVVPAVLLAPWIAAGVVRLLVAYGPLGAAGLEPAVDVGGTGFAVAALAGLACAIGLLLPVLAAGTSPSAVRAVAARAATRTLGQRLGLDLALVVLAGVGVWQLHLYGTPLTRDVRGALGLDPVLVATPAIGLLAGSVLATRAIPRLGELAERVLERGRGLAASLGGRQLARRPLRATRAALLLIMASALGTFAVANDATWTRSQVDQADYQAATDVRLDQPASRLPSWAVGPTLRATDGVAEAMPVVEEPLAVGRVIRTGTVLGLAPATAAAIVHFKDAATRAATVDLLGRLGALPAGASIAIDAGTRRLSVRLDASFAFLPGNDFGFDIATGGIAAQVVLADADGWLHRFTSRVGTLVDAGQRLVIELPEAAAGVRPVGPFRLHALEISIHAPRFTVIVGSASILGLDVSPSATGDDWVTTAYDPGANGWSWQREDTSSRPYTPPDPTQPGLLAARSNLRLSPPISPDAVFRSIDRPSDVPRLAAIVSDGFLAATSASVGSTIQASVRGRSVELEIVGAVATFPPLDPGQPFAIVDGGSLGLTRFWATTQIATADSWWLGVDPGHAEAVADAVRADPVATETVVERGAVLRALATDPVQLGIIGALGLGAVAAIAFAAIGFVVSAALAAAERVGEFALLRALGLSAAELSAWLTLESATLLVVGLLAGGALGLVLAWLVLPFATLTATGAPPVPVPEVVVPWFAVVPALALAAGLLVVTIILVRRQLLRVQLSGVLRARDE